MKKGRWLLTGTDAGKPAAGEKHRFYWATDTKILYRDTGAAWEETARGETTLRLAQLAEKAHGSLTGIGASDHHTKTTDASEITSGTFDEARIPNHMSRNKLAFTADKLLKGAGPGANPVEIDPPLPDVTETTGTFSFDETSAAEQTMVTVTITERSDVNSIWIDMVNVTQNTTIKVYHKIDGTNFREVSSHDWTTADSDGVLLSGFAAYRDIRISLACSGGGAGSVNVPYAIV